MSSSERNDKTDKTDAFHSGGEELGTDYLPGMVTMLRVTLTNAKHLTQRLLACHFFLKMTLQLAVHHQPFCIIAFASFTYTHVLSASRLPAGSGFKTVFTDLYNLVSRHQSWL